MNNRDGFGFCGRGLVMVSDDEIDFLVCEKFGGLVGNDTVINGDD